MNSVICLGQVLFKIEAPSLFLLHLHHYGSVLKLFIIFSLKMKNHCSVLGLQPNQSHVYSYINYF